jgi:hypothetical protein
VKKLSNEELHNINSSPNMTVTKLRRMRWVWHVERMRDMRNGNTISVGKPRGKRSVRRIILKWILRNRARV